MNLIFLNITNIYLMEDTEVEFLVASCNYHLGIRLWIIGCAWFEYNVSIVLESAY